MNALPKFAIISLTDAARERVREIIENADKPVAGVRVGVRNAGCAGMAYTLDYVEEVDPADDVVEEDGFKVFVDPKAVLFLLGTEMDYEVTTLSSGFVFNNPNQTSACGCGESVAIKPADPKALQSA
ncbi:MAG: Fe-S cluster assembly scaffold SufA [Pseudomonadota bacterium]